MIVQVKIAVFQVHIILETGNVYTQEKLKNFYSIVLIKIKTSFVFR